MHFYNSMHTYTTISPYLFKNHSLLLNQIQFIASYLMLPVFSQISFTKHLVGCRMCELCRGMLVAGECMTIGVSLWHVSP